MVEVEKTVKSARRTTLFLGTAIGGLLLLAGDGIAQERPVPDSLATSVESPAARDTAAVKAATSPSGIDSVVTYASKDSVVYSLSARTMHMYGQGEIRYKELGLKAEQINVNWITSVLHARGVPDTADTSAGKMRGQPDLIDGGENFRGSEIAYNFRTKKGKIDLGQTEIEKGFYYGEDIKKVGTDVLFVGEGRYTTCELGHPHYYFASPTMKVTLKEDVVARPVYFHIDDVPVFALPFGIFPTQRGRRSGIIAPAYGESSRGRYLTHLGYYWAMSDYTDLAGRTDLYTKGSWVVYADFRYAVRYLFSGTLGGSYARTVTGEPGDPDYGTDEVFNLRLNHNQEFDPTTRLVVDLTFTSSSYYQQTSYSLNDLLKQNVVSNATLTKTWEGTPNSMTVNVRRDQIISGERAGEVNEILPGVSFSHAQSFPFRFGRTTGDERSLSWYELIGFTYSGQFLNSRNRNIEADRSFRTEQRQGVLHLIGLNFSPRLGYVTLTPFVSYTEKWYNRSFRRDFNQADSVVTTEEVRGFQAVRTFDLGVSVGTKLFGIVQPGIFGIKGIRHQVVPSLTYTYQPDFSEPRWGYFGRYTDAAGREVVYSYYDRELFGGAPAGERQAISLRIGNVFEMKTAGGDSAGQENKFQLLNLDVGTGYNFARDSLKFDEIGLGFRTAIGQFLNIGGSSRYNLYKFEPYANNPTTGRRIDSYLLSEGKLADMTAFSISISTAFSGEKQQTTSGPVISEEDSVRLAETGRYLNLFDEAPPDFSIPWNLQLSWNFSQSQSDPRVKVRSSNIAVALGFNLTENWKINTTTNYDILARQVAAPQITVYRDLHCWEMNFNWIPTGPYRNFQLEIRLKQPMLKDVRVTKQGSVRGIY